MGYVYHMKKCGKQESELEKLLLNCSHCGKVYKSKAGLEYHLKSEHAPVSLMMDMYQFYVGHVQSWVGHVIEHIALSKSTSHFDIFEIKIMNLAI